MATPDEIREALRRRRAAKQAQTFQGGGAQGSTPPIGLPPARSDVPVADAARALRIRDLLSNQRRAFGGFMEAEARRRHLEQTQPGHPMLAELEEQMRAAEPLAGTPLSRTQEAALLREKARGGDLSVETRLGARRHLRRAGDATMSAAKYPLRALSALVRPFDSGLPAALTRAIEQGSYLPRSLDDLKERYVAAGAGMDPLGRFTPEGTRTERWTNAPPSWHDVTEKALERWGTDVTTGVVGASSDPASVGKPYVERRLAGVGRLGAQVLGTIADIGLSPSTYLTAGAGAGKGVQLAGKTILPDKAVTAIARFPGSAIDPAARAIADRLALSGKLEAAHKVSRAGAAAGRVAGPAQVISGAPRLAGAIPVGGSKTVGDLVGEAFNRYHLIDKAEVATTPSGNDALRAKLREIAQMRESATGAQTAKWVDEVDALLRDVPVEEQRAIRDMIENPGAFDWGTPGDPLNAPPRASTAIERTTPRRPDVAPERLPFGDEPAPYDPMGWMEELRDRLRRAEEELADSSATWGRDSAEARAARAEVERLRPTVRADEPLGEIDEALRRALPESDEPIDRWREPMPRGDEPPPRPPPRPPEGPPPDPLGPANPPPRGRAPREKRVDGRATTSGPGVMFGQAASPTAVPGTPDAMRYGPTPEHLSGQVPTVSPQQAEIVARTEKILREVKDALKARRLIKGRDNYFPRERTAESLRQQRGPGARVEKVGRGVNPRLDYRAGFQNAREEHAWINGLIDTVNRQDAAAAARAGKPAPAPIPAVEDTTSAVNTFWRRMPDRLKEELGVGREVVEPERFLDSPAEALQRYLARATKSVNDADALSKVQKLDVEGRPLARPFVYERPSGVVEEKYEVPVGGAYDIPKRGPGVRVETGRAPPDAPRLGRGKVGRRDERMAGPERRPVAGALPGEVKPDGAFEGVSPIDPLTSDTKRPIPGYVYPQNPAWRSLFPNQALPQDVATWIDAFGKPYWANEGFQGIIDRFIVQPLHKIQLPWKVAATSGAGPRFALRNYYSQQIMNLQAYGPSSFAPRIQTESHLLGLPDEIFAANPALENRLVKAGGKTYTAGELREAAKQTGLWRTMPEAETWSAIGGPFSDVHTGPAHATRVGGWSDPRATLSAAFAKAGRGAQKATRAVGPVNPFSKDFFATKGVRIGKGGPRAGFHPLAEYGERQGRMAALLLELDAGKDLVRAAQDAATTHVNYQSFSPAFEKYGTLLYPFAKFGVGMAPNQAKWALQYPGRTMVTERMLRGGEHMVPPEERERYSNEPRSQLITEAGGRLLGWPGQDGAIKEPEVGRAKGPARLPYVTLPPTADTLLNAFGIPARVLDSDDRSGALASELLEDSLPALRYPWERMTGRNVYTNEPINMTQAQPAPRAVQVLYRQAPELAARLFRAAPVTNERTGEQYLGVPQGVTMTMRYLPNVAAADIVAGFLGGKRPYDNQVAMALRLLGVTQVLHDPLIPAAQDAQQAGDVADRLRKSLRSWTPATDAPP